MDSRKPSLDLEKELTCSICTDLLYQPLTLLDCLHTFCGSCLKEWFRFQAAKIERNPSPPAPDDVLFTCPSCRAPVRDTRPNATVVTLLEMFFAAKPEKARSEADKEEVVKKYKPGDLVLPKITTRERTTEEKQAEEEDRRLIREVREMSLREAESGATQPHSSASTGRSRSNDNRSSSRQRTDRSPRTERVGRQNSDQLQVDGRGHRRQRSDSRQRQVEHQSSIRSLIGSAELSERDIQREIEEFARQIQEEGLLDGLDLDNIDLARNDDLSKRITEAYRRKQREKRSNAPSRSPAGRQREASQSQDRLQTDGNGEQSRSRSNTAERPVSGSSQTGERPRTSAPLSAPPVPVSSAGTPYTPDIPTRSGRRRTNSGGQSTIMPFTIPDPITRPAGRSQTDLTLRTQSGDLTSQRPGNRNGRSSSVPSSPPDLAASGNPNTSFASRLGQPSGGNTPESNSLGIARSHRPTELSVVYSAATSPAGSPTFPKQQRRASPLFAEPLINCARCGKEHIEYEIHYNCGICSGGNWNMCLNCYRTGKGCHHWFGFGHGAVNKWNVVRQQQGDETLAQPHVLIPSRYLPPPSAPGGADGRRAVSADDPSQRLETGTFCSKCLAWTNDCYWRCDICNDGEWGFCNNCVNQGKSCSHMLLPLIYESSQARSRTPDVPPPAQLGMVAPLNLNPRRISSFKPLMFSSTCDICHTGIPANDVRFHCYSCTSRLVPTALPGDYDICSPCYAGLVDRGEISQENGYSGWRRCLNGHRMALIGFVDNNTGRWRYIDRDMVGGRTLRVEAIEGNDEQAQGLQKWTWRRDSEKLIRLVSQDIANTAPRTLGNTMYSAAFPPDGGVGLTARAKWAWYPTAETKDELLFPRSAEIKEIEDVNGDWFFGVYMGAKGLFPAPYVQIEVAWV